MTTPSDLILTYAEAEAVGRQLHDRFVKLLGAAPMAADDMGWGDIVQTTLRLARDTVAARPTEGADG